MSKFQEVHSPLTEAVTGLALLASKSLTYGTDSDNGIAGEMSALRE